MWFSNNRFWFNWLNRCNFAIVRRSFDLSSDSNLDFGRLDRGMGNRSGLDCDFDLVHSDGGLLDKVGRRARGKLLDWVNRLFWLLPDTILGVDVFVIPDNINVWFMSTRDRR